MPQSRLERIDLSDAEQPPRPLPQLGKRHKRVAVGFRLLENEAQTCLQPLRMVELDPE